MFFVIFFLLGLSFGYAAGFPWALVAFLVPLALVWGAADKNGVAIVVGFVVMAVGLLLGFVLSARGGEEQHA